MTKITFVAADGSKTEIMAENGQSLMQAAVNAGVSGIIAECGGACACGTCHCFVEGDWFDKLPPAAANEKDMLEFVIDPQAKSRLSCQITVTSDMDGLVVHTPESQT